jgi:multiple sugar transport system permease protein
LDKKAFMRVSILPAFVLLLGLGIYPLVQVIQLSVTNRVVTRPKSGQFVGIANFIRLFNDARFGNALKVTLTWEVVTVLGTLLLAILIAVFMYNNVGRKLKSVLTFLFMIPAILPRVAAAYIWRLIYSPVVGVLDYLLGLTGLPPIEFLGNQSTALLSVAFIDIWQWSLLFSVIILGVLEAIDVQPIEAAHLDGVGKRQLHWYITLPIIRPTLVSILFLKIVESFRTFDLIYILTKGGPGIKTETIDLYAYNVGLSVSGRIAYGAAISLIMLIVTLIVANSLWGVLNRENT